MRFERLSVAGVNSLERIYQGKCFTAGPVFSLINLKAAQLYCHRFSEIQHGAAYIIVAEKNYLRIWTENTENNVIDAVDSPDSPTIDAEFIDACQKKLAMYIGPIAKMICKKALRNKADLTRQEFVARLSQKISDSDKAEDFKRELLD